MYNDCDNIKILIAYDKEIYRKGMMYILNENSHLLVCGEASAIDQLITMAHKLQPDVIISGYTMQHVNCVEELCMLAAALPATAIIVYDNITDANQLTRLKQAGIKGLLQKTTGLCFLIDCVWAVYKGNEYFDKALCGIINNCRPQRHKGTIIKMKPVFNKTEMEVLRLTCLEHTNGQIAAAMFLSIETIKSAKKILLAKTGSKNMCGLVKFAIRNFIFKILCAFTMFNYEGDFCIIN